ncbi:MAG: hypothetical protein M0Z82_13150 [Actinomycetota bacterium]|nr:hypothetical protein [Actinomycetota bacterium]
MGVQVPPPTLTFAHGLCGWRFDGAGRWPAAWPWAAWERAVAVGAEARLDDHHPASRVVGELEPELAVDLGLVLRRGGGEHAQEVAEAAHQGGQLVAGHGLVPLAGRSLQLDLCSKSLGLDLGDPGADDRLIGAGLERSAVAGEASVAFAQPPPRHLGLGLAGIVGR